MIRVVALPKAIAAGLAGAAVMEVYSFAVGAAGLPSVDFVRDLSAVAFRNSPVLTTASALAAHLSIGVCWAIFYAFFVWGRIHARPLVQGLVFSLLPATLAILIVYPELSLIRRASDVVTLDPASFLGALSPPMAASLLVAHALFGLTIGAIYRRPVGYAAGKKPSPPAPRRARNAHDRRREGSTGFMFATGIECS